MFALSTLHNEKLLPYFKRRGYDDDLVVALTQLQNVLGLSLNDSFMSFK